MKDNTLRIAEFLTGSGFDELPTQVIHEAKRSILDTLGCMIAGMNTPLGESLIRLAARFPDQAGCSILGREDKAVSFFAALAHGFMANAHDADDGHRLSRLHAGAVIIPAALAAAEQVGSDGRTLIEAVVIGFELSHRVGMASTVRDLYFGSAHGGAFGAAVATGKLLGLTEEDIINAMGICEMHAPSSLLMGWIDARQAPMVKEGIGWGAASGLMAAYLAAEGITGTLTVFDGLEAASDLVSLGEKYQIQRRYYKPYPGCRWSHPPLQTLWKLMDENQFTADQVKEIKVRIFDKAVRLDRVEPPTIEDAEYSIPFILGAALAEGEFGPDQMRPDKLSDPAILTQARKVRLEEEPEFNAFYPGQLQCQVEVKTEDGQVFSARSGKIKGDENNPLSDGELTAKFIRMAKNRLTESQSQELVKRIWQLENQGNIRALMGFLRLAVVDVPE